MPPLTSMRIIALPLTSSSYASGRFAYYYFQNPPRSAGRSQQTAVQRRLGQARQAAVGLWKGFGEAPEGSWKNKTYKYGARLMDRVDFEELALHSVDTSLGPQATKLGQPNVSVDEKQKLSIPLLHPTAFASTKSPLEHLQSMLVRRTPDHKAGMYRWGIIAIVVSPFGILPIIPNLPLYFAAWRAWSHYRAYKACEHLESLIKHDVICPVPSTGLDQIYHNFMLPKPEHADTSKDSHQHKTSTPPSPSPSQPSSNSGPSTSTSTPQEEQELEAGTLVLSRDAIPKIISLFELPQTAAADISRGIKQTLVRMAKTKA